MRSGRLDQISSPDLKVGVLDQSNWRNDFALRLLFVLQLVSSLSLPVSDAV